MTDGVDTRANGASLTAALTRVAPVAIGLTVVVHVAYYFPRVVDDLFISLRFADNFAHGRGIVFNPGERVEGYSSPLWMLLQAIGLLVGFEGVTWTKLLGIASFGALLVGVHRFARERLGVGRLAALLPAAFLALDSHIVAWSVLGLETPAYLALLVWYPVVLGRYLERGGRRSAFVTGAVAVALACARPEAGLFVAVLGLAEWTAARAKTKTQGEPDAKAQADTDADSDFVARVRARWPVVWRLATPVLIVLAVLLVARRAYFGLWLPHTYYVKGASSGFELAKLGPLVGEGAAPLEGAVYVLGIALAVAIAALRRSATVAAAIACTLFFTASVERDWMPSLRHLLPLAIFASLAWAWAVERVASMKMELARTFATVLALTVVGAGLQMATVDTRFSSIDKHDRPWALRKSAEKVRDTWMAFRRIEPPHVAAFGPFEMGLITQNYRLMEASAAPLADSWAVGRDIGMVGYYSDVRVFDTGGLFTPAVVRSDAWRKQRRVDAELARATFAHAPVTLELLDEFTAGAARRPELLAPYEIVVGSPRAPTVLVQREAPRPTPAEIARRYDDALARFPRAYDLHTLYGEAVGAAMRKRVKIVHEWLAIAERGAGATPPARDASHGAGARLAGEIESLGCEIAPSSVRAGTRVTTTCWWRVLSRPSHSYGTFLHFIDASGAPKLLGDHPAGGLRPTIDWRPGEIVRDEASFVVPLGMPPGRHPLRFGMWSGDRRASVAPATMNDGMDRVPGPVLEILP